MPKKLLWLLTLASVGILNCRQLGSSSHLAIANKQIVEIQQTTVATIEGVRIVVGNIFAQKEYTLPDGSTQTGQTAMVGIEGDWHAVGKGSIITIGESQWKAIEVQPSSDGLGKVILEQVGG